MGAGPLEPIAPLAVPLHLLDDSCLEHLFQELAGTAVGTSNGLDHLVPTELIRIRETSAELVDVLEGRRIETAVVVS